jgi:hypothetical protein
MTEPEILIDTALDPHRFDWLTKPVDDEEEPKKADVEKK